jgi:hypothetical protein
MRSTASLAFQKCRDACLGFVSTSQHARGFDSSDACVAWIPRDLHGTISLEHMAGRHDYRVSFEMPDSLVGARKKEIKVKAEERTEKAGR